MDYLLENVMFIESKKNENSKWDIIENKMNFKFPQDYKEFIDIYGEGGN
ncbi:MAG TPA: SMI1/KNR4 family protein [Candidatus Dwaynia gallinarum]|nr:SMI1/KNR4 family protein [Candidatus Dwaynia gallinarum]